MPKVMLLKIDDKQAQYCYEYPEYDLYKIVNAAEEPNWQEVTEEELVNLKSQVMFHNSTMRTSYTSKYNYQLILLEQEPIAESSEVFKNIKEFQEQIEKQRQELEKTKAVEREKRKAKEVEKKRKQLEKLKKELGEQNG